MTKYDVLVCGSVYTDIVFAAVPRMPRPGEEVFCKGFEFTCGGGTYIISVALARMGIKPAVLAPLGNDFLSNFIGSQLEREGLSAADAYNLDRPHRQVTAAVNCEGDRAFVTYEDPLDVSDYQAYLLEALDRHDATMLIIGARPQFVPVIEKAKSKGMSIVFDIGWDDEWIYSQELKDILRLGDWFTPNLPEALAISGKDTPEEALEVLQDLIERTIIKLGPEGALFASSEGIVHVPGFPVDQAIDTTGAGDNFLAGLLTGVIKGWDLKDAVRLGNYCGAESVKGIGGTATSPTWEKAKLAIPIILESGGETR
ncbi:carbohydrate kinase family protein [Paenibacillus frigoriresistens]|uniref:carbohydrate kinase family protein n=1 Tax=Paenibacillus alginolyticus TaxID=59839 RepID=UPI0015675CFD|nr:carbohydrate kinase family protein [Paenibacillus frigoriresistens]NRF94504.1 carbohydrate kinase family protein [Paenibacillus frigoriresistens]